jgi:hypothetical protein
MGHFYFILFIATIGVFISWYWRRTSLAGHDGRRLGFFSRHDVLPDEPLPPRKNTISGTGDTRYDRTGPAKNLGEWQTIEKRASYPEAGTKQNPHINYKNNIARFTDRLVQEYDTDETEVVPQASEDGNPGTSRHGRQKRAAGEGDIRTSD